MTRARRRRGARRRWVGRARGAPRLPRRAGGGSLVPRARLRAGTCLMRLGAFEDAHAEFLIAAEGDAGGTAAEARRLAGDAARGGALVDSLTRVDGGALASLRRRCIEGASVGARRVKTRVFRAAEGSGGLDGSLGDDDEDEDALEGLAEKNSSGSPSKKNGAATTARDVLRSVRDVSAVAPHCAAVAEARARALLWEGRFEDAAAAADAEGLGGAAHRRGACASRDASLADAPPRAFALETGGERWRARVRAAARFATGDLAGAAAAMEASGGDGSKDRSREEPFGGDDDDETRSKPSVSKRSNASVMNDDASLVAARVARALEAAETDAFADLIGAARAAHARVRKRLVQGQGLRARFWKYTRRRWTPVADAPAGPRRGVCGGVPLQPRAAAPHAEGAWRTRSPTAGARSRSTPRASSRCPGARSSTRRAGCTTPPRTTCAGCWRRSRRRLVFRRKRKTSDARARRWRTPRRASRRWTKRRWLICATACLRVCAKRTRRRAARPRPTTPPCSACARARRPRLPRVWDPSRTRT